MPETLNGSNIPYWQPEDSGRLPEYYSWTLNLQRQLPGRFMVEAGYNAQLGRHLATNLLSPNQVDPEIFYGFVRQYGAAGAINLMNSRMDSTQARQAGIAYPYPGFPGSQSVRQALRPYPRRARPGATGVNDLAWLFGSADSVPAIVPAARQNVISRTR